MREQRIHIAHRHQPEIKPLSLEGFGEGLESVTRQIEMRAFQLFEKRGCESGHDLDDWFKAEAELLTPVQVNISEEQDALRITVEVPGFTPDDLGMNLEKSNLTIYGKRESKNEDERQAQT